MQEKEIHNQPELTDIFRVPERGRLVALDPGTKRIGVAVCDELQITARALPAIARGAWKKLLLQIKDILGEYDAVGLVLGLPYNFDGGENEMSTEARRLARNFALSLSVPVVLQDERLSTYQARGNLWRQGYGEKEVLRLKDSESAAVILRDFIELRREMRERTKK